jgi:methylglutaconyl-CoA hydratase/polyketide biosynthesis enoyl-CoA hydratase PksH
MSQKVSYHLNTGVGSVRIHSPETGNALDAALLGDLHLALTTLTADPHCRVIVISAEGKAFCTGMDIEGVFGNGRKPDTDLFQRFLDCLILISNANQVVIAIVEGKTEGGGLGLAAACDIVLATHSATFMLSEVILGLIPALIAPFLLRRLSPGAVRYLALSSRRVGVDEAQRMGLVDEVVEAMTDTALERQLGRLLRSSPAAIAQTKRYLQKLSNVDFGQQQEMALEQAESWLNEPDVIAGVQLFADGGLPFWFTRVKGS